MNKMAFRFSLGMIFLIVFCACSQFVESGSVKTTSFNIDGDSVFSRTIVDYYGEDNFYTIRFDIDIDGLVQTQEFSGKPKDLTNKAFTLENIPINSKVKIYCFIIYEYVNRPPEVIWKGESKEIVITDDDRHQTFEITLAESSDCFSAIVFSQYCISHNIAFDSTDFTEFTIPGRYKVIDTQIEYYNHTPDEDYPTAIFAKYPYLQKITIENGVKEINWASFRRCKNLKEISLPNTVDTIHGWSFEDCENLTSIYIPEGVTVIEEGTFLNAGLENVVLELPSTLTRIEHQAFENTKIKEVTIPASVTFIDYLAFQGCPNLTKVTVFATEPPVLGENPNPDGQTSTSVFDWSGDYEAANVPYPWTSIPAIDIIVPSDSLNAYKNAPGWSEYANIIVASN